MIHYHGFRGLRADHCLSAFGAGHAFISYHCEDRDWVTEVAQTICQSFALDNGAFTAWRAGKTVSDWSAYYDWVSEMARLPGCDFAVIPDVIDGSEEDNNALLREWPHSTFLGAPVWHMDSSLDRLEMLIHEYPRVCIGSSGAFSNVGSNDWWNRITAAMSVACDSDGYAKTKLHGLRMLNPSVFTMLPLSSADSTNLVRNTNMENNWRGTYLPPNGSIRAQVLRSRIESHSGANKWIRQPIQTEFFP